MLKLKQVAQLFQGQDWVFLPTTQADSKAVALAAKAIESGCKGVKTITGANTVREGLNTLRTVKAIGNVGSKAGIVLTFLTPAFEAPNSLNMIADDMQWIEKNDPNNTTAKVLGYVGAGADACSWGFVRSLANTIPYCVQLGCDIFRCKDPKWTNDWQNAINDNFNAKNINNQIVNILK